MNDYIIAGSIFLCTFVLVCVVYDCMMTSRLERRMREAWDFIDSMQDFDTKVPDRQPF
jgi:hypothetical protein